VSSTPEAKPGTKRIWKYFVLIWLLPIVLIVIDIVNPDLESLPLVGILLASYFIAAFLCFGIPYMRRNISYREATLLGMVAPFIIWVLAVFIKVMFFDPRSK